MLVDFCHSEPTVGAYGAVTNTDAPDPMIARGTVCGFDGSLVLVHWDLIQVRLKKAFITLIRSSCLSLPELS